MRPTFTLQWRVLLLIAGGMALTLLLSGYLHGLITRSLIEEDRYNAAVSQTVAVAEHIAALQLLRSPETLHRELALVAHGGRDLQQIDVYHEAHGAPQLVASTSPGAGRLPILDERAADNELHELDHPLPDVVTIEVNRQGVRYWIITITMREIAGTAYVSALVVKNAYNPMVRRLQLQYDTVLGCAMIACLGLSYVLFLQFFRRPARDIVHAMTRAREGRFESRIAVTRQDELGVIALGFNAMMDDLSARDLEREALCAQISRFNGELREQVTLATTEVRTTNAALFQAQQRLNRAERLAAMGEVAAALAHEIGTPLNSISGHVQLLARRLKSDPDAQRRAGIITQQLDLIVGSVRALLRRADKPPLRMTFVDLSTLLTDLLRLVGPTLDSHSIAVSVTVDPALAPVHADADSLQQVLLNLINNSVDAMPGGGRLEIRARPNQEMGLAEIVVADTGPGLAPEILDHLFEPMWTTKTTGSGFGLSIARRVMAQHGGSIEADLTVTVGARFILRLPIAVPALQHVSTEAHHGA